MKRNKTNIAPEDGPVSSSGYKIPLNLIRHRGDVFSLSLCSSASSNGLVTLIHVDQGNSTRALLVVECNCLQNLQDNSNVEPAEVSPTAEMLGPSAHLEVTLHEEKKN